MKLKAHFYALKIKIISAVFRILGRRAMIKFLIYDLRRRSPVLRSGHPVILTCDKTHFSKDVDALMESGELNYLRLNNGFLEFFQSLFVSAEILQQTFYQKRQRLPEFQQDVQKLRDFAKDLLNEIERQFRCKIDLILVSHIDYGHVDCLRLAGIEKKIPFVCLVRENFILPREQTDVYNYYLNHDFKFDGDRILVFSQATKDILVRSSVAAEKNIIVTGAPRFDHWRTPVSEKQKRHAITLFSFSHPDYLAPEAFKVLVREFVKMANERPQNKFYIKAKDRVDYFRILSYFSDALPDNLNLDYRLNNLNLFKESFLILGFNSLALLEGLMAGCRVAIPYFMDAARPDSFLMYTPNNSDDNRTIQFFRTVAELHEMLHETDFQTPELIHLRRCIDKIVLFQPDRTSVQLVEAELQRVLNA